VGRWVLGYALIGAAALLVSVWLFLFYFGGLAELSP
jgi:hypothetical protein